MKSRKILSLLLVGALTVTLFSSLTGCSKGEPSAVFSDNGTKLGEITSAESGKLSYENPKYAEYMDFCLQDASQALAAVLDVSTEKAAKLLTQKGYSVSTAFNIDTFEAIKKAYEESKLERGTLFASAVTDLSGGVTALYSSGTKDEITNLALAKSPPYSSLKPLSVYTPAMEKGIINWSIPIMDAPFKKIVNENGDETDWPTNANGIYTEKNMSIGEGVRNSVNTVSVGTLDKLNVHNSLDFLKNSFGLDLTAEREKAKTFGDEEIYGNLAMGYLIDGVSPLDMAGYYAAFGNKGKYVKPYAVTKITDSEGNAVYKAEAKEISAMSEKVAYIMNRMLKTVVENGGTGSDAYVKGVEVCGKTGTGSANGVRGNWFVGLTPQYSCTVWHGGGNEANMASEIFGDFVSNTDNTKKLHFSAPKDITRMVYCTESGGRSSSGCSSISMGYFDIENIPEKCSLHSR